MDNPILKEIRAIKLEHSTELAAICAEILQIKEAVNSRNNFCRKHVSRCPNCTVTKSNCSHCFECGSSEDQKSVCLHHDKAKVAQVRHAATVSIKITCNIRCVCKKKVKILYKCTTCQSGNYYSKACQTKQYPEHKKYWAVISELDSREKHKLEQFTVTDSEVLPNKYRRQLVRLIGENPIIEGYTNNKTYKRLGIRVQWLV